MHAAVVREFARSPRYEEFDAPTATRPTEEVVDVIASGLHPRVRSQADGSHYTSTDELPLIPGIDGVGRRADGSLVYFLLPDTTMGAMAEQTVIDVRRSIPLPADTDAVRLAAAMNPAMSSWVALHKRATLTPGQSVLVLGGTGSAGRLAIQVARRLGAGSVIAAGRGAERLATLGALGADETIDLAAAPDAVAADLATKAADVDVVLDYLWGTPTEDAIMPLLQGRADRSKALTWIEIGSVAGATIALPSAALRQANLRFVGSGQGSVSAAGILSTLPALVDEINAGTFAVDAVARPLSDVEALWSNSATNERIVLTP
ncbi:quinone oxidoreductase family protein [Subtercola sp. YIM 133946]|uniref:quinone oxidoreductase family protein n=1 Tax=Subtercola sp. YIM 133946 TaxID=3118909 RepID=UPI002F9485C8